MSDFSIEGTIKSLVDDTTTTNTNHTCLCHVTLTYMYIQKHNRNSVSTAIFMRPVRYQVSVQVQRSLLVSSVSQSSPLILYIALNARQVVIKFHLLVLNLAVKIKHKHLLFNSLFQYQFCPVFYVPQLGLGFVSRFSDKIKLLLACMFGKGM